MRNSSQESVASSQVTAGNGLRLRIRRMLVPSPGLYGLALLVVACSGPTPPIEPEPEKTKVSLSISADLTEVNVDVDSPITLSTLQAVITFDPAQIQLSNATQGADGPRVSNVFDDGARVPGKLLVGLADVNQNPLPRSGSVVRVALTNSSAGDVLGLESVVAVDIFGNKVPAEDIEVTGVTVE
jgi:hypothetical protein